MGKKYKVLLLAANPRNETRLRLAEEVRTIKEYLRGSKKRDTIQLVDHHAVRPTDVSQHFLDVSPNIVHFSGHGTKVGELCLEDSDGLTRPVDPEALSSLFEILADQVVCVFLNCCYSVEQADALAKGAKYVICMNDAIGDDAAIHFSGGFYKALGAGRTIEESFQFGLVELRLMGIPQHKIPRLLRDPKCTPRHVEFEPKAVKFPGGELVAVAPRMPDHAVIDCRNGKEVYVNPDSYKSLGEMLDEIYKEYLSDQFPPRTYGSKWVLIGMEDVVVAPLEWAAQEPPKVISGLGSGAWQYGTTMADQGIVPGSSWRVHSIGDNESYIGVALRDERAARAVMTHPKGRYWAVEFLESMDWGEFDPDSYPHQIVFLERWRMNARLWVEAQPLPRHELRHLGL